MICIRVETMKKSKAFTLAETIMTLFIVGLVVTASIPMFTKSKSDPSTAPGQNTPWAYCDSTKEIGLCQATNENTKILIRNDDTDAKNNDYALTVYTGNANFISPYDIFQSDERAFKVGDYIFKENRTTLLMTNENIPAGVLNNNTASSIIVGRNTHNSAGNPNFALTETVTIGNGNTVRIPDNNIQDSTVIGNNNTTSNDVNTIVGEGNQVSNLCATIGNGNQQQNNAVVIGSGIDARGQSLNIGNVIFGNPNALTFNGNVSIHGGISANSLSSSDERLKNIKGKYTKGLKEVLEVEPVVFRYKGQKTKHIGVVAQDLQKIFPEAVVKMPDGYLGVNTDPVFFAMLNAMKEVNQKANEEEQKQIKLQKELDEIKSDLESLSACKNDDLWSRIRCFWYDTKMFFKGLIAGIKASEVKYEKV